MRLLGGSLPTATVCTVTYSGRVYVNPGQMVRFYLYHNDQYMGGQGEWISSSDNSDAGHTRDQGSRSLVSVEHSCSFIYKFTDPVFFQIVYLGRGDTLHLGTFSSVNFNGDLQDLTFCVTLTGFDYCILDDSCLV